PRRHGGPGRRRRWTTPICAISSSTCIASSTRKGKSPAADMENKAIAPAQRGKARARRQRPARAFWRRIRQPLVDSHIVKNVVATLLAAGLRFVARTNPAVEASCDLDEAIARHTPGIVALW